MASNPKCDGLKRGAIVQVYSIYVHCIGGREAIPIFYGHVKDIDYTPDTVPTATSSRGSTGPTYNKMLYSKQCVAITSDKLLNIAQAALFSKSGRPRKGKTPRTAMANKIARAIDLATGHMPQAIIWHGDKIPIPLVFYAKEFVTDIICRGE